MSERSGARTIVLTPLGRAATEDVARRCAEDPDGVWSQFHGPKPQPRADDEDGEQL